MTLVLDFVRNMIPANWSSNPTGWVSGNCPMCVQNGESRPDTKGRGGFLFEEDKFRYNCFNCNYTTGWAEGKYFSSRLKRLMKQFGIEESDIQRLQLELLKEQDVATLLLKQKKRDEPVHIDIQLHLQNQNRHQHNLLQERHLVEVPSLPNLYERGFDITDNRLWYSDTKTPARMYKRFIVPFFYKGIPVGYTARWIGNPPEGMPKYYNQQPKNNFVYGLDSQTKDKNVVIVTEGQLDAIFTDGVAIGSNNINDDQANIIDSLNKRVIVLPDADASGMKMVNKAVEAGVVFRLG